MAPKQAAQKAQQPAASSASAPAAESELEELFEKLDRFIKNDQHKKALKAAEDILAVAPHDEDAQLAKVAALMQQGNWEQAHTAITKSALAPKLRFELAYCLYKLGKADDGLVQLAPLLTDPEPSTSGPAMELAAQLHYRLGHFQQCIQLYNSLFQQHKADSLELKCNVLAAYVAAGLSKELPGLMAAMKVTADHSFEVGYNKACALVDSGQWSAAETELRRAIKRGRETLFQEDEECTEEEVEEELSPLTVQLAYVLGRLGRHGEAQELYDTVLRSKSELADEPTRAVAINNSFADSGRIDALAAHRKTVAGAAKKLETLLQDPSKPGQLTLTPSLEARMSPAQKQLLSLNRALVYLLSGRAEGARQMLASLQQQQQQQLQAAGGSTGKESGAPAHLLPLLQAALLQNDSKVAEADALLEQFAASHPTSAFEPQLARAQLALEGGNVPKALTALAAAQAAQQQPGAPRGALVATQVALLTQAGDAEGAEAVLIKALSALKKDSSSPPEALAWCLEALLQLQLRLGRQQDALATFGQLQATGTQSAAAAGLRAKLLWSLAGGGAPTAAGTGAQWPAGVTKGLASLAHEVRGLNVDALENSIASARPEPKIRLAADEANEEEGGEGAMDVDGAPAKQQQQRATRKRGKKRKRYPKGYDASQPGGGLPPPDPERWLPKWQRTDSKKKKLKSAARDKGAVKGSQGAGKVDESLDVSKAKAATSSASQAGKKAAPAPPAPAKKKGKK